MTELKDACPMCAALSDRKIKIDLILVEGDLVGVRSTWSGSYSGTVRGMTIDGKYVSVVYTNIYRVAGGKMIEHWAQMDGLSLVEQLGMKLIPVQWDFSPRDTFRRSEICTAPPTADKTRSGLARSVSRLIPS